MENTFFWAQIIGLVAMAISIFAWQLKNPRHIIMSCVPAASLWGIQYIMLGAPLGAITNFSSAFKDTALPFVNKRIVPYLIGTFLIVIWSFGLFFYSSWYDSLPLVAVTALNFSLLQRDNRPLIARTTIFSQICWITYNLIVGSWMGLVCGLLVGASSLIGMARHEGWTIGRCHRTFFPSLAREFFVIPSFKTYP